MNDYLKKVAARYDERFRLPDDVRQAEQKMVGEALQAVLLKRNVVEIGCGAGYWTQFISPAAKSIFAFDPREEAVLAARERSYFCPVTFETGDIFALPYDDGAFDGGSSNFFFDEVPRQRVGEFLREFHRVLVSGSHVFISGEIKDARAGGHTRDELLELFAPYAENFGQGNVFFAKSYWYVAYTTV